MYASLLLSTEHAHAHRITSIRHATTPPRHLIPAHHEMTTMMMLLRPHLVFSYLPLRIRVVLKLPVVTLLECFTCSRDIGLATSQVDSVVRAQFAERTLYKKTIRCNNISLTWTLILFLRTILTQETINKAASQYSVVCVNPLVTTTPFHCFCNVISCL